MPSSMKTPNRRMTLGVVSSSRQAQNRRMSIDPSSAASPSAKKGKKPPRSRKSMLPRIDGRENAVPPSPGVTAPTQSSRRKSVGGRASLLPPSSNASAAAAKADPRPINDKTFQQRCIRDLLNFLLDNGYDNHVTEKTLTRPSTKDFASICTFLLRLVDPNFQRGNQKFEDEVALNFKCIGYPFNVSKTALVAAGTQHTWPSLLAALAWLVDHLKVKQAHDNLTQDDDTPFQSLQELETKSNKAFFDYLLKAYQAFMSGDSELADQLEFTLAERIDRDDAYLKQEVQRVTDLNSTIVERLNDFSSESQDFSVYVQRREEYATDLEQFHDLILQMNGHKASLEQKVEKNSTELAQTNEKLSKMNGYIEQLKNDIQNQELSVEDVRALEYEMKGLNESLDRAQNLCEKRKQSLVSAKSELESVCNALDTAINDYNLKQADLRFLPGYNTSLGRLKGILNKDCLLSDDVKEITGVDFGKEALSVIEKVAKELYAKMDEAKASYQDILDKVQNSAEECQAADAKLEIVKERTSKIEKTIKDEEESHKAKNAVRQREIEALESKVASRRDPVALEEQIAAYQRQCAELEALQLEHQEENTARVEALQNEIDRSTKLMMENEAYWQAKINEVREYWSEKESRIQSIAVPNNMES